MKLYNTLTRQVDLIEPIRPGYIGMYTCGPTVYDYAHIGHWYNYVRMDTLLRVLKLSGYKTTWVMNITDVGHLVSDGDDGEDKLEKGAKRDGKTAWQVAEMYTTDFLDCMQQLAISTPDHIVKATDHIAEQIELIKTLQAKGYTYTIDDGIYFDTSKFEGYAAFAQLDLDEQQSGGRVRYNAQKRNSSDFAVWKFSPAGRQRDMEWPSPFSEAMGFPGWHIECSAMSMKYLGKSFDIHTGGIDHIPVHHTNEIAQSEAATGQRLANYWMHGNHVTVNGEKVSKSLDNGIRLQTIIQAGISASAVRLHVLESHYRSQAKFSWDSLQAAHNRLQHWRAVAALYWQVLDGPNELEAISLEAEITAARLAITALLQQDLATPAALSLIDELLSRIETEQLTPAAAQAFKQFNEFLNSTLGIDLLTAGPLPATVQNLFDERRAARANHDWVASDRLRDELQAAGYGLRDASSGRTTWLRL